MDENSIRNLFLDVKNGRTDINDAVNRLKQLPYESIALTAHLDHHRELRCGFPEVVFGQGKTAEQIVNITKRLAKTSERVMVTRLGKTIYENIKDEIPTEAEYHEICHLLTIDTRTKLKHRAGILIMTAGTSDIPVAEEAAITAEMADNQVQRLYDVGVAGIHRLLGHIETIQSARVIIVVAGMDGALPSVVSGLVDVPVIAVPTSVGYGASFQGLAALLTMLNSCANGVAVVNIDNGFGAGYMAAMINRQRDVKDEV